MSAPLLRPATIRMVDRVTDACVSAAARRWPDDLSQTMAREWRAELAMLRADRAVGAAVRTWRAITFAVSLAFSRSVESEDPMSAPLPGRLPGLGRAMAAAVSVFGVALLASALFGLASSKGEGNLNQYYSASTVAAINGFWTLLAIGIMGWIGTVAGRRGFRWLQRSPAMSAIACTAPLGIAMWLVLLMPAYMYQPVRWVDPGLAAITWIALSAGTLTLTLRLAAAGRRAASWIVGIAGSLVALDIAAIVGGLRAASQLQAGYGGVFGWFPLSMDSSSVINFGHYFVPADPNESPQYASGLLLGTVGPMIGPLLLCSAFVVAYALRAARAGKPAVAPAAAPMVVDAAPIRLMPFARWTGAVGVAIGWAVLIYLTAADPQFPAGDGTIFNTTDMVWYHLVTILLIAGATVMTLAARGPVVLPAIGTFVVLFTADCVINRTGSSGGTAVTVLVVCAATLSGAWWLAGWLSESNAVTAASGAAGTRDTEVSTRRALLGTAVLVALAIPMDINVSTLTPRGLVVVQYVIAAALCLLAITAALASRRTPLGRLTTIAYLVVPLAVVVGFNSAMTGSGVLYYPRANFFIQAPLAVVVLAAARWRGTAAHDRSQPRWRSAVTWVLYGIGAAVASVPISDVLQDRGGPFADLVTRLDPGRASVLLGLGDSNPSLAGQLVLAIALAVIAARWTFPPRAGEVVAAPDEPVASPSTPVTVGV